MTTTNMLPGIRELSDENLLLQYNECLILLAKLTAQIGHYEQEIYHRMEIRGATMISTDKYSCESPPRYEYPLGCFTPLKELLTAGELATCYTPAHREMVPEHYEDHPEQRDTRKVLSVAKKLGGDVQATVDRQRIPRRMPLKLKALGGSDKD